MPKTNIYQGSKAYLALLSNKDVDAVLISSPCYSHPGYIEAALAAGKHVYSEKPVAVDVAGCEQVIRLGEMAKGKLNLAIGFQIRFASAYVEMVRRIQQGDLGEIINAQLYYFSSGLPITPYNNMSYNEARIRNRYHFQVLSGGILVDQGIHMLDVCNWALQAHPLKAIGTGMEKMKLILFPGEEIRTPKICLMFWKGEDRMIGHNQFRQFVLAHHTRRISGSPSELPLSAMIAREGPPPCNEHTCSTESFAVALINRYQQFKIVPEVFWLDAGWYPNHGDWHNVGSWIANKENFPNGLKPVSDAAHMVGAKFLLWFEPERVTKNSQIEIEHPEWLTEIPNSNNESPLKRGFIIRHKN